MPKSKDPHWIDPLALLLLHSESLAEHGGLRGVRDQNAFEAALARPRHLHTYESKSDLARLAAGYGYGLVRDHPFVDGNKRAGLLAVGLFLALNGKRLTADPVEAIAVIMRLAEGRLSEEQFAAWIRTNIASER